MTKFNNRSFSVHLGSPSYRDNYDAAFKTDRSRLPDGYAIRMVETGGRMTFRWFLGDLESAECDSRREAIDAAWRHLDSEKKP